VSDFERLVKVYEEVEGRADPFRNAEVAHLVVSGNRVVGAHLIPGLSVEPQETDSGIKARVTVQPGAHITYPVHLCFGVLPERGRQTIDLNVQVGARSRVSLLAHCMFPNAIEVQHVMEAEIEVAEGATYEYHERHVHGPQGGVVVLPKARVNLAQEARFRTEFELLRGAVGSIEIDYATVCAARATMEMVARISGRGNDQIRIHEKGELRGENSRGVLKTRIAVRDHARAEVVNELTAHAAGARGHVDCKEIVQDMGVGRAIPIVDVTHPLAHVTHEAAIGSVDSLQLQTLMARGLSEDQAVETIIQGLLA